MSKLEQNTMRNHCLAQAVSKNGDERETLAMETCAGETPGLCKGLKVDTNSESGWVLFPKISQNVEFKTK